MQQRFDANRQQASEASPKLQTFRPKLHTFRPSVPQGGDDSKLAPFVAKGAKIAHVDYNEQASLVVALKGKLPGKLLGSIQIASNSLTIQRLHNAKPSTHSLPSQSWSQFPLSTFFQPRRHGNLHARSDHGDVSKRSARV